MPRLPLVLPDDSVEAACAVPNQKLLARRRSDRARLPLVCPPRALRDSHTQGSSAVPRFIHTDGARVTDSSAPHTHAHPPVTRLFRGSVADEFVRISPLPMPLFVSRTLSQIAGADVELEHQPPAV